VIIVVGVIEVEAGERGRYLADKRDQVDATLAEPGCVDYSFAADAGDPARVRLLERWASMTDLEAHLAGLRLHPPATGGVAGRFVEAAVYEAQPTEAPRG
jgi:quinol monooxygenase YgiN